MEGMGGNLRPCSSQLAAKAAVRGAAKTTLKSKARRALVLERRFQETFAREVLRAMFPAPKSFLNNVRILLIPCVLGG
jgi:hypothetical protein